MQKVSSHSTIPQILSDASPDWHIRLNELADLGTLEASDHQGASEVECRAQEAKEAKLQKVCQRISYIEMALREKGHQTFNRRGDLYPGFHLRAPSRLD